MNPFVHVPVLHDAVLAHARLAGAPRFIVDSTVGGAGHATALLQAFPAATLLGLDRDPTAVAVARERLATFGARAQVVQARFSQLQDVLAEREAPPVDVLLADFGVSSHQLDERRRGFSFQGDAPLDMRMDPDSGMSAAQLLHDIDEAELARAIRTLGEERYAGRVARVIAEARPTTTQQLAQLVRSVVRKSADGIDPATRTFQAIRMLVNDELPEIETWLAAAPEVLADGGIVMAISFHSLEDRAVKVAFRSAAKGCICPPSLPVCACGKTPTLRLVTRKAVRPDDAELQDNPRSRSSRLRVATRLARGEATVTAPSARATRPPTDDGEHEP